MALSIHTKDQKPYSVESVYYLRCPVTLDIFYVGKSNRPDGRLIEHIKRGRTKIKDILSKGLLPIMFIVETFPLFNMQDRDYATYREAYWIDFYTRIGFKLDNRYCTDIKKRKNMAKEKRFKRIPIADYQKMLAEFKYETPLGDGGMLKIKLPVSEEDKKWLAKAKPVSTITVFPDNKDQNKEVPDKLLEYENELKTIEGKNSPIANQRRKWLNHQIVKLKL